jgi:hypothetical protein
VVGRRGIGSWRMHVTGRQAGKTKVIAIA